MFCFSASRFFLEKIFMVVIVSIMHTTKSPILLKTMGRKVGIWGKIEFQGIKKKGKTMKIK